MKISEAMGANGLTVCDCGKIEFYVLIKVLPNGNNHIVTLRCTNPECGKELATPYQHGGPTVSLDACQIPKMETGRP